MLKLKRYPKRSPYWYIRGTVAGIRLFESTGIIERGQAEEFRQKREREIVDQAKLGRIPPTTFAAAVAAYVRRGGEKRFLTRLLLHFSERPLSEIGQIEVDNAASMLYPDAKASTLNRQVYGPMIAVLRHAAEAEMPGATRRPIKMRKEIRPVVTPASDEHIAALLPHCSDGLRALIILMTYTGLRTGEALRVKQEDIRDGFIHISRTKNGQPRMVPVPQGWVFPANGFEFSTTQGVGKALRRAHDTAGLPYKDGHEIGRHGFAARWLRNGGGMKGLQLAGGWEKMATLADTYAHLEISEVHAFMRKLSVQKEK